MSLKFKVILVVCFLSAVLAGSASAAPSTSIRGVVLNAPHSVTPQYGYMWWPDGTPRLALVINGPGDGAYVVNNDGMNYNCSLWFVDRGWDFFDFSIAPRQIVPWNIVTPYTGQTSITFQLYCNGSPVPGQTSHVHVNRALSTATAFGR
jgi:hypothetical protein